MIAILSRFVDSSSRPSAGRMTVARWLAWAILLGLLDAWRPALAFPPAPHHLLYGCVRDEYGTPLFTSEALIVLQTPSGVKVSGPVLPGVGQGVNFALMVPMDAGASADLYQPSALRVAAPFKIYVVIGQTTNLPIQMSGDYSRLGQPGQQTRLDLTLGVDANGDGLPDAWEHAFLSTLGSRLTLNDLSAGLDLLGNGRSLKQEFLLGYYPFDPVDSLAVTLVSVNGGAPILQFTAMTGRSYSLLGSADLQQWTALPFLVSDEGPAGGVHTYYYSPGIANVQIQAVPPASGPPPTFFKILLQ